MYIKPWLEKLTMKKHRMVTCVNLNEFHGRLDRFKFDIHRGKIHYQLRDKFTKNLKDSLPTQYLTELKLQEPKR